MQGKKVVRVLTSSFLLNDANEISVHRDAHYEIFTV